MNEIAQCVYKISLVSGTKEKEAYLKAYAKVPGFKEVLQFIFNPYIKTGIAAAKLSKMGSEYIDHYINYDEAIAYYTTYQTGSSNDILFGQLFINCQKTHLASWLATTMVTKDLQIGVSVKTLNKVYGKSFIPVIDLMLGEKYSDFKDKVKGPFIVTEKFDGIRRLLIKHNGIVRLYSRSGIEDTGLIDIVDEAQYLPDNMVYDGELLAIGKFVDSIALRQATNSIASTKGVKYGLTYNIFDILPIQEFNAGTSIYGAAQRKFLLGALLQDESVYQFLFSNATTKTIINHNFTFIKPVPILGIAHSEQHILDIANAIWDKGFEGVMLNIPDGKYELKRSKSLLKVKRTNEYKLEIVGIQEGTNKYTGMLGALLLNYKGQTIGCGSGFTDAQRKQFWTKNVIGKMVEIESFGESVDKYTGNVSLNVPIFKRMVGEVE